MIKSVHKEIINSTIQKFLYLDIMKMAWFKVIGITLKLFIKNHLGFKFINMSLPEIWNLIYGKHYFKYL